MPFAALLIYQPDGSTTERALDGAPVVLGRDETCDVVVISRLVSRRHAQISRVGNQYLLEDLNSRNGTQLNGQPISSSQPLRDGDRISLGGSGEIVFLDGDATSTRPTPPVTGIWLEQSSQSVWVNGQQLLPTLSPAQFRFLQLLISNKDHVCSREMIVAAVWPDIRDGVSDEALDALIKRVRARLAEVPGGSDYLVTLRGRGMMLRSK
jgi:DNA-binding response OmpR family regulator